jgi:hypothetical protein
LHSQKSELTISGAGHNVALLEVADVGVHLDIFFTLTPWTLKKRLKLLVAGQQRIVLVVERFQVFLDHVVEIELALVLVFPVGCSCRIDCAVLLCRLELGLQVPSLFIHLVEFGMQAGQIQTLLVCNLGYLDGTFHHHFDRLVLIFDSLLERLLLFV